MKKIFTKISHIPSIIGVYIYCFFHGIKVGFRTARGFNRLKYGLTVKAEVLEILTAVVNQNKSSRLFKKEACNTPGCVVCGSTKKSTKKVLH